MFVITKIIDKADETANDTAFLGNFFYDSVFDTYDKLAIFVLTLTLLLFTIAVVLIVRNWRHKKINDPIKMKKELDRLKNKKQQSNTSCDK